MLVKRCKSAKINDGRGIRSHGNALGLHIVLKTK